MVYASRCKCFKSKQGCTCDCRCKNCTNPYGARSIKKKNRVRSHQKWQHILGPDSQVKDVILSTGKWSALENFIFIELVQELHDCIDHNPPTTFTLAFNETVHLLSISTIKIPEDACISKKTEEQVSAKIRHFKTEKELYEKLQ